MIEQENTPDESLRGRFLQNLLETRSEAISGRTASGIEVEWTEDEEHYQGIDDANRRFHNAAGMSQPKQWAESDRSNAQSPTRSVVFLNITRPYVDAASARISDMLMPTDDRSWVLKPTPIPRLSNGDIAMLGGPEAAQATIDATIEEAKEASARMQAQIDDHLVESQFNGELRKLIEDSARLGSGVIKGPYPVRREFKLAQRNEDGTVSRVNISEIRPGSKHVQPWNFFPDPACGDSIHNGAYTWEREYLSIRQLKEMLMMPGYDREELIAAMKEGPSPANARDAVDTKRAEKQFEMWIFHGHCDTEQMKALGVDYDGEEDKLPAMAVLINDRLVKLTQSVIDAGDFPYDVLAWQARPGMPWGMGVSRQIRTVQRILNGATRAMMDNAGESASPQVVYGNGITPMGRGRNGSREWRLEPDATIADVRAAINWFVTPSVQAEMMNIVNFAMKMAEDVTGMPAMLQGIRGDAPQTLGGMQMQNNNSTSVLRRLAKRFDDYVTRPHIGRYYDWMMQYSDDDSIKGDYETEVRASSALVERDAQQQFLMQMLAAAKDPAYGLSPSKFAAELIKGQRLDIKSFQASEEEKAAAVAQPDPVEQAKVGLIAAQIDKTKAETVTKNAESMFSATQVVQNIAANPHLATASDSTWKSAGGVDQDASPAIPAIEQQIQTDAQPNTNPLTPANPDSPLVGFREGIEGGQS